MNLITPANIIFLPKGYCVTAEENRGSSHESLVIKNIRFSSMFIHSAHRSGSTGMKRFPHHICLAFLLLIIQVGIASAASQTTTTTPGMTGGSIYFETYPPGATIWLDNIELGTSPFTYYSDKTGILDVRVRKRLYEDYTDKVVVIEGERVLFYARLTPISGKITEETTPPAPVRTVTTLSTSTIKIPTPWPTSSQESPLDPAVVIGAAAIGIGIFVIRRR
jgi:hypothetical protein